MAWGMLAGAGITALSTFFGGGGDGSAINAQNRRFIADAKATVEANLENTARFAYRVGMENVRRGQLRLQSAQEGANLTRQALLEGGSVKASNAASGTIGASTDAVVGDVSAKLAEAQNNRLINWELTKQDSQNSINDLAYQAKDAIQRVGGTIAKASSTSPGRSVLEALIAGGMDFTTNYARRAVSLDLGPKPITSSGASNPIYNLQYTRLRNGISSLRTTGVRY